MNGSWSGIPSGRASTRWPRESRRRFLWGFAILAAALMVVAGGAPSAQANGGATTTVLQPGPGLNNGTDDGSAPKGQDVFAVRQNSPGGPQDPGLPYMALVNSTCNAIYANAYLRFSTVGMPAAAQTAKIGVYAWVRSWIWAWGGSVQLSLHGLAGSWSETTLAWNSQPAAAAAASTVVTPLSPFAGPGYTLYYQGWIWFDITNMYNAWVDGSVPNNGVMVVQDDALCENGQDILVATSDWTGPTAGLVGPGCGQARPKLVVTTAGVLADTTPPELCLPGPVTADAGSASSIAVTYAASATDPDDPSVLPACLPASGATFPVGDTLVSCTAADAAGNVTRGGFTVHVTGNPLTPPQSVAALKAAIDGSGATTGPRLATYLTSAFVYLGYGTPTMKAAACQQLKLFKAALDVAARTDPVVATNLVAWKAEADAIRAAVPCVPPN